MEISLTLTGVVYRRIRTEILPFDAYFLKNTSDNGFVDFFSDILKTNQSNFDRETVLFKHFSLRCCVWRRHFSACNSHPEEANIENSSENLDLKAKVIRDNHLFGDLDYNLRFNDVMVTVMVRITIQTITEMCLVARSTIRQYYVRALWPPRPGVWHVNVSKHWYDFDADLTKMK